VSQIGPLRGDVAATADSVRLCRRRGGAAARLLRLEIFSCGRYWHWWRRALAMPGGNGILLDHHVVRHVAGLEAI
jgi:hypothetical protein